MLQHKIIVNKPQVFSPVVYQSTPPANKDPWQYRGILADQSTYDKYLQEAPITPGNFVKFRHNANIDKLHQVHYVLRVIGDHKKVPFAFERGHPKPYTLMQCESSTPNLWLRYDHYLDYVVISDDEYDRLVRPVYDYLQNRIKEYELASPV